MEALKSINVQFRVIGAIILRDMRTRFGRTHLGYLIAVVWPLTHALFILTAHALVNRLAPIGGDPVIFVSTGIIPYIMCFYPSRQMTFSVEQNKALLMFPLIRVSDIIFARAILEFLTSFIVVILFFLFIYVFIGIDPTPISLSNAILGVLSAMYLGISMGFINTLIMSIFKFWNPIQIITMIIMYMTSGAFFVAENTPQEYQFYIWFNPLLHCVEWLRSAYYEDYGGNLLSKSYVIIYSTFLLFSGLLGERFIRGKLLSS
jgi:capsular polysaccharide transport system permease protein